MRPPAKVTSSVLPPPTSNSAPCSSLAETRAPVVAEPRFLLAADDLDTDAGARTDFVDCFLRVADVAQRRRSEHMHVFHAEQVQQVTETPQRFTCPGDAGFGHDAFFNITRKAGGVLFCKQQVKIPALFFFVNRKADGIGSQINDCVLCHIDLRRRAGASGPRLLIIIHSHTDIILPCARKIRHQPAVKGTVKKICRRRSNGLTTLYFGSKITKGLEPSNPIKTQEEEVSK